MLFIKSYPHLRRIYIKAIDFKRFFVYNRFVKLKEERAYMLFSDFNFKDYSYSRVCVFALGRRVHFPEGTEDKIKQIYVGFTVEKVEQSEDKAWLYIYLNAAN